MATQANGKLAMTVAPSLHANWTMCGHMKATSLWMLFVSILRASTGAPYYHSMIPAWQATLRNKQCWIPLQSTVPSLTRKRQLGDDGWTARSQGSGTQYLPLLAPDPCTISRDVLEENQLRNTTPSHPTIARYNSSFCSSLLASFAFPLPN